MMFEVFQALRDLNKKTPAYFVTEMFAHAETTAPRNAQEILSSLDPGSQTHQMLIEIICIPEKQRGAG